MVKKKPTKSTRVDLLRIAHFIILNTLIFQEILSSQWVEAHSLRVLKKDLQSGLLKQWERIETDINFGPIFALARGVLGSLPTGPATENALDELRTLALSVVTSGAQLRHDLMGRIYHKLLLQTTGGYYATYYTSVPAAVLISDLLMKTENPNWDFSSVDRLKELRIIDPACGSGTLLATTYAAVRDRFILSSPNPTAKDLAELHRALMESGLYGFDVLDYAAHLTLTTLSMQNPNAKFRGSKIRTLNNGIAEDGTVHLGSLDYLDTQTTLRTHSWGESPTGSMEEHDGVFSRPLPPGTFDCVVMNPPFSRSANPNLKFGYAPKEVQERMSERLSELTHRLGMEGIGVAGLGSHFIVLGDKLLKSGGRIGIVIPRHVLSGVSWQKVRDIFDRGYKLEYIVSNFDPDPSGDLGWCWSENTDLGEVLVIAMKVAPSKDSTCTFVNVMRRPANEVESLVLSQQIRSEGSSLAGTLEENHWGEIEIGGKLRAYIYRVRHDSLQRNWHYPCLFSHPQVVRGILALARSPDLTPLGPLISSKGRDIAGIKHNFEQSATQTSYPMVYGHQKSMKTMNLVNDFIKYARPKTGTRAERMHRSFSSTLLIAERPHLNSEALLSLEVGVPVLATAFWEVKLVNDQARALLLLWLNSTYGFLMALGAGANSRGPIFKIKQDHLDDVFVPRPVKQLVREARLMYDSVRRREFLPFGMEFAEAAAGRGVRIEIDRFFERHLELPVQASELYPMLAQEPAITQEPFDRTISHKTAASWVQAKRERSLPPPSSYAGPPSHPPPPYRLD